MPTVNVIFRCGLDTSHAGSWRLADLFSFDLFSGISVLKCCMLYSLWWVWWVSVVRLLTAWACGGSGNVSASHLG